MVCAIIIKLAFTMLPALQNRVQVSVNGWSNGIQSYTAEEMTNFHSQLENLGSEYTAFESAKGYIHTICTNKKVDYAKFLREITRPLDLKRIRADKLDEKIYKQRLTRRCSKAIKTNENSSLKLSQILSENLCSEGDIVNAVRNRYIKLHGEYTCLNGENFGKYLYEADVPIHAKSILDSNMAIQLWRRKNEKLILVYSRGFVRLVKKIEQSTTTYHMVSPYNFKNPKIRKKDTKELFKSVKRNEAKHIKLSKLRDEDIIGHDLHVRKKGSRKNLHT